MSQYEWETGYELEYAPGELEYAPGELEYGPGEMEYAPGELEYGEMQYMPGEFEMEYAPGELQYGAGEFEAYQGESPLPEIQELEYASQLLEITNEMELEEFLGDIVKSVARAAGGLIRSPVGQALTGVLKTAAKSALPIVGGALGSFVAPGVGTAIGSRLGSMAGNLFELEFEGMDREQAEFEAARKVVQLTAAAAQNAALAPPNAPAPVVAHDAIASAAQRYAPGLLPMLGAGPPPGMPMPGGFAPPPPQPFGGGAEESGRWVRRGRKIVLFGV